MERSAKIFHELKRLEQQMDGWGYVYWISSEICVSVSHVYLWASGAPWGVRGSHNSPLAPAFCPDKMYRFRCSNFTPVPVIAIIQLPWMEMQWQPNKPGSILSDRGALWSGRGKEQPIFYNLQEQNGRPKEAQWQIAFIYFQVHTDDDFPWRVIPTVTQQILQVEKKPR